MHFLCLQSMIATVMPCDLGMVGTPGFAWFREALTWVRRVTMAGGLRAVLPGAFPYAGTQIWEHAPTTRDALLSLSITIVGAAYLMAFPVHAETNRVKFPELDQLQHYATVKRGGVTEHIMTTRQAIDAVKMRQTVPNGTHFVLVDYREGKVHRYFVMQKGDGWGMDYESRRRTGDWQFQWFWPDRSVNQGENTARCQSCHDGRKESDYLYTANRIPNFDRTPIE